MNYQTIIEKIGNGSVREAARQLSIPVTTVNDWRKRGIIPHWREEHIRKIARGLGVNVDEDT